MRVLNIGNAGQASKDVCALSVLHVVKKILKLTLVYQIRYTVLEL